ncbi:hypothetical protein [Haloferula sp. BvORR071]|uniref:hypothetical protein n=1 Tax=Haloferula sp. BvORR071 TaxID=1396141 RepID=UPI00054DEDAC|nr:hypothetical protein [Haloferula sp. BvORR071]
MNNTKEKKAPTKAKPEVMPWHRDYKRMAAAEAAEHCERVENAWDTICGIGNSQLEAYGFNDESAEWEQWGILCFTAEQAELFLPPLSSRDRDNHLSEELNDIHSFWEGMRERFPDYCECELRLLEMILFTFRP